MLRLEVPLLEKDYIRERIYSFPLSNLFPAPRKCSCCKDNERDQRDRKGNCQSKRIYVYGTGGL